METRLAPFLKKPYKGTKKTEKRTALEPIYSRRKTKKHKNVTFYITFCYIFSPSNHFIQTTNPPKHC
jgi:hypothetical protein